MSNLPRLPLSFLKQFVSKYGSYHLDPRKATITCPIFFNPVSSQFPPCEYKLLEDGFLASYSPGIVSMSIPELEMGARI